MKGHIKLLSVLISVVACAAVCAGLALAYEITWSQPPVGPAPDPYSYCFYGWDQQSNYISGPIAADDWQSVDGRSISDIHWWGSYKGWPAPNPEPPQVGPDMFHIAIWTDVPTDTFSHPGVLVQDWMVPRAMVTETAAGCDYHPTYANPPEACFEYTFIIPDQSWFYPHPGQIYWVSIAAVYMMQPPTYPWGWTTRPHFFQDAAVRIYNPLAPSAGSVYVAGEPITDDAGLPWDLAFELSSPEAQSSLDFGDAPDPSYPTLLVNNGARHILPQIPILYLGAGVDGEPDGLPTDGAYGDDSLDGNDDEDGVVFLTALQPGRITRLSVTASAAGVLNAWLDFNADGAWDAVEQIFVNVPLTPGVNILAFPVPASVAPARTYARFRFSSVGGLSWDGEAPDGEVEDYVVYIEYEELQPDFKWAQPPLRPAPAPYQNCFFGWDEVSNYNERPIVADDWLCTDARPVSDIHWWGSYKGWQGSAPPQTIPSAYHIGIWTDVPTDTGGFSHPGVMVWEFVAPAAMISETLVGCDYHPGFSPDPDTCFRYDLKLPESIWFYQAGGQTVYWLSIAAVYPPVIVQYPWGWKTRPHFFNDDAVRILGIDPPGQLHPGSVYLSGEEIADPLTGDSWDMAFVLTSPTAQEELDFGDAPDPTYPTLLASDGARHIISPTLYLGAGVDSDPDGQPTIGADGDDLNGSDDEDGVIFITPLLPGQGAQLDVTASAAGVLNAWVDFNADGVWDAAAEQVFVDVPLSPGVNSLVFLTPAGLFPGRTYARFRFSSLGGLQPFGLAPDGEVEDYVVLIEPGLDIKWSQPPVRPAPAPYTHCFYGWDEKSNYDLRPIVADDWLCEDNRPVSDIHWWGSYLGWQGIEPPTGTVPLAYRIGIWTDVPVDPPTTTFSHPAMMVWEFTASAGMISQTMVGCDYHPGASPNPDTCFRYDLKLPQDLWFYQAGGQTVYWLSIAAVYPPAVVQYPWGWKTRPHFFNDDAVRIMNTTPWPPSVGALYLAGEEIIGPEGDSWDMAFVLTSPAVQEELDYGDAPDQPYPTLRASDGARHIISPTFYMGTAVDSEPDGQPSLGALGDDLVGVVDDEDGVSFLTPIIAGQAARVEVVASQPGYLNAWIDFSDNGDWSGPDEQIFANTLLVAGSNLLSFNVPSAAAEGLSYARFRFSSVTGLTPSGLAPDGEVEDYQIMIHRVYVSVISGNWNDPTIWSIGSVPTFTSIVTIAAGTRVTVTGASASNKVSIEPTAVLVILNDASLTVEDALANNGRLVIQQTNTALDKPGVSANAFHIYNSSMHVVYYGLVVTPTSGALGLTTVAIDGNQMCGGLTSPAVLRCYEISPSTPTSATIQFFYRDVEEHGQTSPFAWHWNGSAWNVLTGALRGGSGDGLWVQATNGDQYSPFILSAGTPTAVALRALAAVRAYSPLALLAALALTLGLVNVVVRRRG